MQNGIETFRGVVFPWHCDAMGHMSVQHQMPLLDSAVYHLLGEFGASVTEENNRRLGWADVKQEISYLHELVVGDLLILRTGIIAIGSSSIRHRTVLSRRSDELACTVMDSVTVRFDLDRRKSTTLSDDIRALAARLITSDVSNKIDE
ncbi:acyl-CoA thioesterase [Hyphococcus lacteus]|uniref:Acyl-CoA thioesterase n=1 Tax=Hyphococcus lacteus TaxID=3143536 RepID=A0ABV3YZF6_9PROT